MTWCATPSQDLEDFEVCVRRGLRVVLVVCLGEAQDACAQRISHCLAGGLAAVDCFDR